MAGFEKDSLERCVDDLTEELLRRAPGAERLEMNIVAQLFVDRIASHVAHNILGAPKPDA